MSDILSDYCIPSSLSLLLSPDVDNLISAVNEGSSSARKTDWTPLVRVAFQAERESEKLPFILDLLILLSRIFPRDYRLDALYTIGENLRDYLTGLDADDALIDRYARDCRNLAHYFGKVNYIIPYFEEAGHYYNEHRDDCQLEVEAHLFFRFLDRVDDLDEYMAFSQANYEAIRSDSAPFSPYLVALHTAESCGRLSTDRITLFCSALLMAETTRRKFINGWDKPSPVVTLASFPLLLRNRCFDHYISLRIRSIRQALCLDNRRLHEPSEKDCLLELRNEETQDYNQLLGIGRLPDSKAYVALWKPATPDILGMAQLFLQYLDEKIGDVIPHPAPANSTSPVSATSFDRQLLDGLLSSLADESVPLSVSLNKAVVLAEISDDAGALVWMQRELNGYPLEEKLPAYRVLPCRVSYMADGPFGRAEHDFPVESFSSNQLRDDFSHMHIRQPMAEIEHAASHSGRFWLTLPEHYRPFFSRFVGQTVQDVFQVAPTSNLAPIFAGLRLRLQQWSVRLAKNASISSSLKTPNAAPATAPNAAPATAPNAAPATAQKTKTDKKKFVLNIQKDALSGCFINSFFGKGQDSCVNYFEVLCENMETALRNQEDVARLALLIYNSGKLCLAERNQQFTPWLQRFFELCGLPDVKAHNYRKSKLENDRYKELARTFSCLEVNVNG